MTKDEALLSILNPGDVPKLKKAGALPESFPTCKHGSIAFPPYQHDGPRESCKLSPCNGDGTEWKRAAQKVHGAANKITL